MQRADLSRVVAYILDKEGGYVHRATDPGGETNFGISKRFNPDIDVAALTREEAAQIWMDRYVTKWQLERFPQRIANKLTDLLCPRNVMPEAIQVLQRALFAASARRIAVDGVCGPITTSRLEEQCRFVSGELMLQVALRAEIAAQYRLLVARAPSLEPNLKGWLNRSYS